VVAAIAYFTPERAAAQNRSWRERNPEASCAVGNRRRARANNGGGSYTASEWLILKAKYKFKCLCCKLSEKQLQRLGRKLVPDHVKPLAKQGRNSISNIQPLCHGPRGCNNRKHAKHIDYR
jgi:hypothetical protein